MDEDQNLKDRKTTLKDYFNKKCFGAFGPAEPALLGTIASLALLSTGSLPFVSLGIAMTAFSAGKINQWQKTATGKHIWEPKLGKYGFGL